MGLGVYGLGNYLLGMILFSDRVNTLLEHGVMMVVLYGSIWTGMAISAEPM